MLSSRPRMPVLYSFPRFLPISSFFYSELPSRPVLLYLLTGSLLYGPIFHYSDSLARAQQQENNPSRQHLVRPGPASNLIIRRLIICGRDKNYVGTIIFSRELSFPFINDLIQSHVSRTFCGFYRDDNFAFHFRFFIYQISFSSRHL